MSSKWCKIDNSDCLFFEAKIFFVKKFQFDPMLYKDMHSVNERLQNKLISGYQNLQNDVI